jgi:hypothetical protein
MGTDGGGPAQAVSLSGYGNNQMAGRCAAQRDENLAWTGEKSPRRARPRTGVKSGDAATEKVLVLDPNG